MNIALILAAGKGTRFGNSFPKQLVELSGKTILEYSLDIIESLEEIEMTMLVIDPLHEKLFKDIVSKYHKHIEMCKGGITRQQSVFKGLKRLDELIPKNKQTKVFIHDSARPFARIVFRNVLEKLEIEDAAVPIIKSKDTIYVIKEHTIVDIPCRDYLFNVQTPQGFSFEKIFKCHKMARVKQQMTFTDDGSLYATFQKTQPAIVDGDQMNFKITDKRDLLLAEYLLTKERTS